jgi:hypothetical protein
MRCETFLARLDALDAGRSPDAAMRAHASRCASCARQAEACDAALLAYRALLAGEYAGDERLDERIMATIRLLPPPRQDISLRDWISVGAIIALSMLLIPFGREFSNLKEAFGARYSLPLALVLSFMLTGYMALFIGTHIDAVQGFLDRRMRPR